MRRKARVYSRGYREDLIEQADALAAWRARYDVARRTIRGHGLTRYMAASLLVGYGWLAAAGGLRAGIGQMADGPAYDAELQPRPRTDLLHPRCGIGTWLSGSTHSAFPVSSPAWRAHAGPPPA